MKKDLHVTPVEIKRQRKLTYYPWCHSNRDFPEDMSLCLSVFLTNDKLQILSTQWEKYFWFVKFIFVVKFSGKFSSVLKRNLSRQVYVCNACHRSNIATLSSVRNYQVHDQLKIKIALLTNVGFELYFDYFFPSVMSFTSTLFLISSVVLPKTLLFISLKKSFSNEFLVVVRFCVLKSMYCFNQGDCLNCNALWTFFKKRKPYTIEGFCNEARNLFLLIMSELAF